MPRLDMTVRGTEAVITGRPEIIGDNSDYTLHVDVRGEEWSSTKPFFVRMTVLRDGEPSEYEIRVLDIFDYPWAELPAVTGEAYAVEFALLQKAGAETNTVRVGCERSIRSFDTVPEPDTLDVYNTIAEMLKPTTSGAKYAALYQALLDHYNEEPDPEDFPSEEYIIAMQQQNRASRIAGTVTLKSGTVIEIDDTHIAEQSFTITSNAITGECLLPGGAAAAEAKLTLRAGTTAEQLYGAEINLTVYQEIAQGVEYPVPLGVFTVGAVGDDSDKGIPITAYDDMIKLDETPIDKLPIVKGRQYAPQEIIEMCAQAAGVSYDGDADSGYANTRRNSKIVVALGVTDAFAWTRVPIADPDSVEDVQAALDALYGGSVTYRGDIAHDNDLPAEPAMRDAYRVMYDGPMYTVSDISTSVETARDLLAQVCGTLCAFACIDRYRKLRIVPLAEADADTAREITTQMTTRRNVSRYAYRLFRLTTEFEEASGATGAKRLVSWSDETLWPDGVTAVMKQNALLNVLTYDSRSTPASPRPSLIAITHALDPVVFYPFDADIRDDASLGLFDWVNLGGKYAPITAYQWKYHGTQRIECCGTEAILGYARTQAEKEAIAAQGSAYENTDNLMRSIYEIMIQTYQGLQSFTYRQIGHFTYAELGRRDRDE